MSNALPMQAVLYPRREAEDFLHAQEIARRITEALPHAIVDWERGHEHWDRRRQELIARGTPEVILQSHEYSRGHVVYISVTYPQWPNLSAFSYVWSINRGLSDAVFLEVTEPFHLELLKRAAADISAVLDFGYFLEAFRHSYFRTHTESGHFKDPLDFLRRDMVYYEGNKATFSLQPLSDWKQTLQAAFLRWLAACTYKPEVDARLKEFASPEAFATAVVVELEAISPVQRSWGIDIAEKPHHHGILLDHGNWMTLVHLNGVSREMVT